MRAPELPRHYRSALGIVLVVSAFAVIAVGSGLRRTLPTTTGSASPSRVVSGVSRTLHFFFLGAGFMLLETKSIVQFALLWGSTWASASLAIASGLVMALASTLVAARVELRRPWIVAAILFGLLALNYLLPIGRVGFDSRVAESV